MIKKTFIEHLTVIKKFFTYFLCGFLGFFLFIYLFLYEYIYILFINLLKSMAIESINYMSIYEGLFLPIKLSFYISIFVFLIIFFISFMIFINVKQLLLYFLISLPIVLYINFTYLIPITWKSFFAIKPLSGVYFITINEVLEFIFSINLCGLSVFYIPTIIVILNKYQIMPNKIFNSIKKYWKFISILISGFLAPGDILSHLVMSFFMIIYFYFLCFIF